MLFDKRVNEITHGGQRRIYAFRFRFDLPKHPYVDNPQRDNSIDQETVAHLVASGISAILRQSAVVSFVGIAHVVPHEDCKRCEYQIFIHD